MSEFKHDTGTGGVMVRTVPVPEYVDNFKMILNSIDKYRYRY